MRHAVPVGERAYRSIKQHLLDAAPAPGERLDILRLGHQFHVSTTPVREALHRLAAERLVDNRAGEGFFVPRLGVSEMRRLYEWHARLAAEAAVGAAPLNAVPALPYREQATRLFRAMAETTSHAEVAAALANADDRLRSVRPLEPIVVKEAATLLAAIEAAWRAGDRSRFRRELARRARRLGAAAGDILEALEGRPGRDADIRDISNI